MLTARLAYAAGAALTAALLWLGALWPSVYTFAALLALPAPAVLGWAAARPAWLAARPRLRAYAVGCVALALVCVAFQAYWLARA